jgi:hypothetical protein
MELTDDSYAGLDICSWDQRDRRRAQMSQLAEPQIRIEDHPRSPEISIKFKAVSDANYLDAEMIKVFLGARQQLTASLHMAHIV